MHTNLALISLLGSGLLGLGACKPGNSSHEALHRRNFFYVGGHYENITEDTYTPGEILVDQMYVEELIPARIRKEVPLVFWAGLFQTGTNWLNTPDGRQGWASFFLEAGYVVYTVDQPQRGRSPRVADDGVLNYTTVEYAQRFFTASQRYGLWPQAGLHTQWPGDGVRGDAIFDAFYASQVQAQGNSSITEGINRAAGVALLERIGAAILVTHSQAGPFGWGVADERPDLVKAIVALEPSGEASATIARPQLTRPGPPFQEQVLSQAFDRPYGPTVLPLTYEPPVHAPTDIATVQVAPAAAGLSACILQQKPARKLVRLASVPVCVISSEASFHAPYDYCTVDYLRQASVAVDWINLPDHGIHGNGHFMFLEKNSLDVVRLVHSWIDRLQ